MLLLLLAVSHAAAAPGDDSVHRRATPPPLLEREFSLTVPSLRVENGVVSLAASDIATVDRGACGAPSSSGSAASRAWWYSSPAPCRRSRSRSRRRQSASRRAFSPTGKPACFQAACSSAADRRPALAALRSVAGSTTSATSSFSNLAAVSFGESFAFYRDRIVERVVGGQACRPASSRLRHRLRARSISSTPTTWSRFRSAFATRISAPDVPRVPPEQPPRRRVPRCARGPTGSTTPTRRSISVFSYEFADAVRLYGRRGYLFGQTPSNLDPLVGAVRRSS